MPKKLVPKGPETARLVSSDRQRLAVEALREAGEAGLTREELMAALAVTSTRTVDRAIALLGRQGARIGQRWSAAPRRLHWVLEKGPAWDENLSAHARVALKVALATLDQGGSAVWADHLKAFEQVADLHLTSRDRAVFEALRSKVKVHGSVHGGRMAEGPASTLLGILQVLGEPVHTRAVLLRYASASSAEVKDFAVVPYLLTHDVFSGGAFLLAWHLERRMPLHLRLSRIRKVAQGRITPLLPSERQLLDRAAHFQIGGWIGTGEPFAVKARIHGRNWVQALLEATPALPEAAVKAERGGTALLTFQATEFNAPARWLLQFGPDAEVLEPAPFRQHLQERLEAAAARYR
jgi:predicted DNA-binding transcriptional regulator YafY